MHATIQPPAPPAAADQLGESVLRHLSRVYWNQFSTSPIRSAIFGVLTLGLWPLLRLRRQFRDYIIFERQTMTYLAEWIRTRLGGDEATAFADSVKQIRYSRGIQLLQTFCVIAIIVVMTQFPIGGSWIDQVRDQTWKVIHHGSVRSRPDQILIPFIAWNVGLAGAYLLHLVQIGRHERNMAVVLAKFAAIARREGVELPPTSIHCKRDLKWAFVGIILAAWGGFWAVPMVLAGAAQRRYVNATSPARRMQIATPLRQIHARHRPLPSDLNYTLHARRCENNICRATLPTNAKFCPRCGTRSAWSEVA